MSIRNGRSGMSVAYVFSIKRNWRAGDLRAQRGRCSEFRL